MRERRFFPLKLASFVSLDGQFIRKIKPRSSMKRNLEESLWPLDARDLSARYYLLIKELLVRLWGPAPLQNIKSELHFNAVPL